MIRWHRFGRALVLALATGALAAAWQSNRGPGTFTCGQDQSLPDPIPLLWTTIVLAGDGRLYSPCPDGLHGADHREVREAALIGASPRRHACRRIMTAIPTAGAYHVAIVRIG